MGMTSMKDWLLGIGLLCGCSLALAQQAEVPPGYWVAQQVPVGDGSTLQVLEDVRITERMHDENWGSSMDADSLPEAEDGQPAEPLEAQARLVSDSGQVLAQRALGYPLANVKKAPLSGLPLPTFFLSIDQTAPLGSYSGPITEVLVPAQSRLDPVPCLDESGEKRPLMFSRTGKAAWQIVPASGGRTETIQQVSSASTMEGEEFITTYRTFRYVDGQWTAVSREQAGYWDMENDFPEPALFP